jgi:hypothetical protein
MVAARNKKDYVTFWLDEEMKAKIQAQGRVEDRSMSNMINVLVKRGLKATHVTEQQ